MFHNYFERKQHGFAKSYYYVGTPTIQARITKCSGPYSSAFLSLIKTINGYHFINLSNAFLHRDSRFFAKFIGLRPITRFIVGCGKNIFKVDYDSVKWFLSFDYHCS